jgi:hypothetical protein
VVLHSLCHCSWSSDILELAHGNNYAILDHHLFIIIHSQKHKHMNSNYFSLNLLDFTKGLFLAVLTSIITLLYTSIQTGELTFDWKLIGTTALTSALAYIMKNLLTNSQGKLLAKEEKK